MSQIFIRIEHVRDGARAALAFDSLLRAWQPRLSRPDAITSAVAGRSAYSRLAIACVVQASHIIRRRWFRRTSDIDNLLPPLCRAR